MTVPDYKTEDGRRFGKIADAASYIVKACNAHDELVAALKEAKDVLQNCPATGDLVRAVFKADAALAKVAA